MPILAPGQFLVDAPKVKVKYEADDGDIKTITINEGDQLWAGANPEPTGAANDNDSARGIGSSRRKLGERVRYATFSTKISVTDTGSNISVTKIYRKSIPILTKAAYGVGPFGPSANFPGKILYLFNDPAPTVVQVDCTWKIATLTPEVNR